MTCAELLQDCSFEIAARGYTRLANAQSQIPQGTVISIAFLAGDTVPILVRAAAFVRQLGFTPKPHIAARRLSSREELVDLLGRLRAEAALSRKSAALALQGHEVELVTQFGFDAVAIVRWLAQARGHSLLT